MLGSHVRQRSSSHRADYGHPDQLESLSRRHRHGALRLGYCSGTVPAAIGAGGVHALVGAFGMILGGILYALTFDWMSQAIPPVWATGKVQLPQLPRVGAPVIFVALVLFTIAFFVIPERR